ncbi:voltage-gated potassium channel [Aureococcus anophagefferens]|nr:voltage-gated potassium channel [Aureococcus anophagefferens]
MDVLVSPATLVVRSVDQGAAALESLAARGEALDAKALRKTANRLEALCAKAEADARGGGSFAALGKSGENEPSEDSAADKRSLLSRGNSHQSMGSTGSRDSAGKSGDPQAAEAVQRALGGLAPCPGTRAPSASSGTSSPLFLVYVAFWEPYRLGYVPANAKLPESHRVWEAMLDGFFVLDLAVNLKTGFVTSDGEVVMGAKRAATHYLCSWFPIDFVSSMPPVLEYFVGWAARPGLMLTPWVNPGGGGGGGGASSLRAAKLLKIGRVFKIFKVFRIAKILKISSDSQIGELIDDFLMSSASKTAMKLINIVGFTAIFAHFLSCFFAACGGMTMAKYHPIEGHPAAKDWATIRKYLLGLYWAITTISTVGYGDVIPKSDSREYHLVRGRGLGHYEKMDSVAVWMKHHRFPSRIRREVRRYYRAYYSQRLAIDEEAIFEDLATDLQQNIAEFLLHEVVIGHSLFASLPEGLVSKFVTLVRLTRAVDGDRIIVQGEESHSMFIILSGEATVIIDDDEAMTRCMAPLVEGDSFGELAALGIDVVSDCTVSAVGDVELYVLNYADMLAAFGGCGVDILEDVKENVVAIHRRQIAAWSTAPEPKAPEPEKAAKALEPEPASAASEPAAGDGSPPSPKKRSSFLAAASAVRAMGKLEATRRLLPSSVTTFSKWGVRVNWSPSDGTTKRGTPRRARWPEIQTSSMIVAPGGAASMVRHKASSKNLALTAKPQLPRTMDTACGAYNSLP